MHGEIKVDICYLVAFRIIRRVLRAGKEKIMKTVELNEAKAVNGGARWYCPECDYMSYWHAFLDTANEAALSHRRKYKGHNPYAFS